MISISQYWSTYTVKKKNTNRKKTLKCNDQIQGFCCIFSDSDRGFVANTNRSFFHVMNGWINQILFVHYAVRNCSYLNGFEKLIFIMIPLKWSNHMMLMMIFFYNRPAYVVLDKCLLLYIFFRFQIKKNS